MKWWWIFRISPHLQINSLTLDGNVKYSCPRVFICQAPDFNEYPLDNMIILIKGDHWKHVRNILTPTFSSGKLRKVHYMAYIWHNYICHIYGIYMSYIWHIYVIYMAYIWHIYGIYMVYIYIFQRR